MTEVAQQLMSRKRFMQKWYQMTDREVDGELAQITLEVSVIDGTNMEMNGALDTG
jgi:hypothetical protein